jgi:catalase (peroxidase I)
MAIDHDLSEGKCPFTGVRRHNAGSGPTNAAWWPNQLNLKVLRQSSPNPILWARISIMLTNSKVSIWMP